MDSRFSTLLLFLLLGCASIAQNNDSASTDVSASTPAPQPKIKKEFIFKPAIGLGTGMFSFYGDIYDKHFQAPMVSRIGYDLNISQYFTDYLQMNFYVLFGKLGANERYTDNKRDLNFESQIRAGGVNVLYNFGHFLPKDRTASPYISLGIESFEFLSKTDLFDENGKRYYYWSDGTTRDIDENSPSAASAILLHRDYTYESDVREQNLDGFGKYAERSFAVPIGVGAIMKINDHWDFKIGTTMHFSFTDYIDGISDKSVGNREGNAKNDNFMMTSFSVHYDLGFHAKDIDTVDEDTFSDVDFFALDLQDSDKDGVTDAKDSCQGTPEGTPVDLKGCPLDDDNDGVPNYQDDELNSPMGAFVDVKGVQLTDSIIAYQYAVYMDSTGAFAKVEYHDHTGHPAGIYSEKDYAVSLGTFKNGLAPELMTKFLSISDISSTNIDDSTTIYTSGKFNNYLDAEKRRQQLVAEGIKDAKIVYKQNGKYIDAPAFTSNVTNTNTSNTNANTNNSTNTNASNTNNNTNANNNANNTNNTNANNTNNTNTNTNTNNTTTNNTNTNNTNSNTNNTANTNNTNSNTANSSINKQGVVLRVQLGAYHRKLSKSVFKDIGDLIEIKTDDGLYKYMTGSFTTFDAAAKHKVEMLLKGYQGAFITAYKDGKRVSLQEAGATPAKKEDLMDESDDKALNAMDKKLIVFKVQVGVFKNDPPAEKQAKYDKMKNLSKEATGSGLNRYVVGSFNDYASAQAAKNEISKTYGLDDAFIVAFYNNSYITIQEALELLK